MRENLLVAQKCQQQKDLKNEVVLWDFSPLVTELCSNGKESRTQQPDGARSLLGK